MPPQISICTEEDPAFIVKVFATRLKRSLKNKKKAKRLASLKGKFALDFSDGQNLTISISRDGHNKIQVQLQRGVDRAAKIVIHLDANDADAKPKIDGLYRHPLFAIKVGSLLDDSDICWKEAARDFWDYARSDHRFPRSIKLLAIDEVEQLILGEGGKEEGVMEMEIEGSSKSLATLFSGSSILLEETLKGKIRVIATMEKQVEFTRVNLKYMLGS